MITQAVNLAFAAQGPRVTVCESGLEVLGAIEVVDPDLLILDMQTPGLNGLLLISAIRELAPQLPVVAVSEKPQADARTVSQKGVAYATLTPGPQDGADALVATLAEIGSFHRANQNPGGSGPAFEPGARE